MNYVLHAHLGLGDHLINNALVRHIAKDNYVMVLAKYHNVASCEHMWSDILDNVEVLGVKDDRHATELCMKLEVSNYKPIYNGMHSRTDTFNIEKWDSEFYRQASVPFEQSWDGWKVPECATQIEALDTPYIFVHEDLKRGYSIDDARLPIGIWRVGNTCFDSKHIFEWTEVLRNATEIHVMESCFAILADRLEGLKARRLVIHGYMRKSRPPVYRKNWEILK